MYKFKKEYKEVLKLIDRYDKICIFRHELPDFDALGTQMGLYYFLKENYPKKDIHYVGQAHHTFNPRLFPNPEIVDDAWFESSFLAIVVDTGNSDRVSDKRFLKSQMIVKFDHHPAVENYGNVNIVDEQLPACGELLTDFVKFSKKKISPLCARGLYIGIVGDSSRFLFPDTTSNTLRYAADLIDCGINIDKIYSEMYEKDIDDLNNLAFVLNNYHVSEKGVCYYVLKDEDLQRLNIRVDEGKLHINTFRSIKGINIVVSCTEYKEKGEWKVSIRSSSVKINGVAAKYEGGGHDFAAGAKIHSIEELPNLIKDLDNLL